MAQNQSFKKIITSLRAVPVAVEIKVVPVEAATPTQLPVEILPTISQASTATPPE